MMQDEGAFRGATCFYRHIIDGELDGRDNGRNRLIYGKCLSKSDTRRRGFFRLTDRLALADDSLNRYPDTCLRAGL